MEGPTIQQGMRAWQGRAVSFSFKGFKGPEQLRDLVSCLLKTMYATLLLFHQRSSSWRGKPFTSPPTLSKHYPFGDVSKAAGFPRKAAGKNTSLMNLTHLRKAAQFRSLQCYKLVLWFSIFWSVTLFDVKERAATSGQWHHTLRSVCEDRLRIWQTRRSSGQVLRKSLKVYTKTPPKFDSSPPQKMMGLEDNPLPFGMVYFQGRTLKLHWVIPRNSFIWILETLSKVGFGLPFK